MKMVQKLTLFLTVFLLAGKLASPQPAYAQCAPNYQSCDTAHICCNFPDFTCQGGATGGYCKPTSAQCGTLNKGCCSEPNPKCIAGLKCDQASSTCIPVSQPTSTPFPTATPTPTPSCGQHGRQCCSAEPICLNSEEICLGGFCYPSPFCGEHGQQCCPLPAEPCHISGEICLDGLCFPPPTPIPPTSKPGAIDFGQLSGAIPSLKPVFQPGPTGNVGGIISAILPYLFVIAGLLLLFYLIYGGFHMMIAANDEKGLAEAKGKITNALVGFLLLFVSYWLVQIMEYILGIQIF